MAATDAGTSREEAKQLAALAENLTGRGFAAHVGQAEKYACLSVASRSVSQLSETVYAAPADDGTWWFWWSWADRIAPVTEVETAAFKIAYVLTPHADE
ncbi:MAG TPA: hypothetical protein VIV12_25435 [Streptosporangiaceae bacterium]